MAHADARRAAAGAPRRAGGPSVGAVGEVLVTGGLVVLLFVVYELFVTDLITDQRQGELSRASCTTEWDRGRPPTCPSRAELPAATPSPSCYIPRLGAGLPSASCSRAPTRSSSRQGPGHYADTALPGRAGQRGRRRAPGRQGLAVPGAGPAAPGDPIVVETADSWFVYRVLGDAGDRRLRRPTRAASRASRSSRPTAVEVISPTPDGTPRRRRPTGAFLTLTTCHPRYSARAAADRPRRASTAAAIAKADAARRPARAAASAEEDLPCTAGSGGTCPAGRRSKALARRCVLVLAVCGAAAVRRLPVGRAAPAVQRRDRRRSRAAADTAMATRRWTTTPRAPTCRCAEPDVDDVGCLPCRRVLIRCRRQNCTTRTESKVGGASGCSAVVANCRPDSFLGNPI